MKTAKPEMVFFDYGNTLCAEPYPYDGAKGFDALLTYATENPQNATGAQLQELYGAMGGELNAVNAMGLEINQREIMRLLLSHCGVKTSLSELEIEDIFWNSAFPAKAVNGANELLLLLKSLNIRTAIVSNMSFSGEAELMRIKRLIPDADFEFVVTSSDYVYRKPRKEIFAAALGKAQLTPERCVFCGDSVECDIIPSAALGMQPVWLNEHSSDKKPLETALSTGALVFGCMADFIDYCARNWST